MGATRNVGSGRGLEIVSIHAPAWGRPARAEIVGVQHSFNPRPRMGATQTPSTCPARPALFQSTPPHGGDKVGEVNEQFVSRFQSTPPHGGDIAFGACGAADSVSIHAPAWGRHSGDADLTLDLSFQSTPPHGGDLAAEATAPAILFQSTPPHGGDTTRFPALLYPQTVSIHAPAWGRRV